MKNILNHSMVRAATIGFAFSTAAWAANGQPFNGCLEYHSLGRFDGTAREALGVNTFASGLELLGQFTSAPHGLLIKDEQVVHYDMLVDLDLQSLEESTVVVKCFVFEGANPLGWNGRLIFGTNVNDATTTVSIPVCVSRVNDPRSANNWSCEMSLTTIEDMAGDDGDGFYDLVAWGGGAYDAAVPAQGTTPVYEIQGQLLFALDAPITFESSP